MASVPLRTSRPVTTPLAMALGRTLAVPVVATEDVPPFTRSRVDGYAVIARDVADATREAPVRLRIVGEVPMGGPAPGAIASGEAMRIPTGGALPDGADAAVMVEDTEERDGSAVVYDAQDAAKNVTHAGADVRRGAPLFEAGTVLTPARLGLLAATGVAEVATLTPPRVGLLLTGDELVAPGDALQPGQIRDINRYSLAAALAAMGFEPVQFERVPDERDAFGNAFTRALSACDAVVISGGSSAGDRDFTPDVVAAAGAPGVIVHHIRAKPGRPTLLGAIDGKPVIGLPGNPVSALVMLETVGKPVLLRLLGRSVDDVPIRARLSERIDVEPWLEHRIPVVLTNADGGASARPLVGTSAQMHILAFADALVAVPLGAGGLERGAEVLALPLTTSRRAP